MPRPRSATSARSTWPGTLTRARMARPEIDWARLRQTVRMAVPFLDRVIDIGYYPSRAGGGF